VSTGTAKPTIGGERRAQKLLVADHSIPRAREVVSRLDLFRGPRSGCPGAREFGDPDVQGRSFTDRDTAESLLVAVVVDALVGFFATTLIPAAKALSRPCHARKSTPTRVNLDHMRTNI
jgi:hypothetical protein